MEKLIVARTLRKMMEDAADMNGSMNNAGFYFLGHLTAHERARVSLAFDAMIMDYAKRHKIDVQCPNEVHE